MKPLLTAVLSHALTESKSQTCVKTWVCQGRAGIRKTIQRFPVLQSHEKPEQPHVLLGRETTIQIVAWLILQLLKIGTWPKIKSEVWVVQKPVLLEKPVKYIEHVDSVIKPVVKPIVSKILPDPVKESPHTGHGSTRLKPKIIRQEKPAYAYPNYIDPHLNQLNHSHK